MPYDHPSALGAIGVTGTDGANAMAREADVVVGVGTRWADFATASHSIFANPEVRFVNVNVAPVDAFKHAATPVVADARVALEALAGALAGWRADEDWRQAAAGHNRDWDDKVERRLPGRARPPAQPGRGHRRRQRRRRGPRRGRLRRRQHARRPAQAVADPRPQAVPPGVRQLLHGLRDPRGHRDPAGRPRPRGVRHGRRRRLPDEPGRAGDGGGRRDQDHRGRRPEPRLRVHRVAVGGVGQRPLRHQVPLPRGRRHRRRGPPRRPGRQRGQPRGQGPDPAHRRGAGRRPQGGARGRRAGRRPRRDRPGRVCDHRRRLVGRCRGRGLHLRVRAAGPGRLRGRQGATSGTTCSAQPGERTAHADHQPLDQRPDRRHLGRAHRRRLRPGHRAAGRPGRLRHRRRRRRRRPGRPGRLPGLARHLGRQAGPGHVRLPRPAREAPRRAGPDHRLRARQGRARRRRRGPAGPGGRGGRLRHPPPAQGRLLRERLHRGRLLLDPPAAGGGGRDHPVQLPDHGPDVDAPDRHRLRQRLRAQAVRARPVGVAPGGRAVRRGRPARRHLQRRPRRQGRGRRHPRPPRHLGGVVRRLDPDRPLHLRARHLPRQAGPGPRRGQEPRRRHARRRHGLGRRRAGVGRLRLHRPALHGHLHRRGRRQGRRRPGRQGPGAGRAPCAPGPASTPPPTWGRWSPGPPATRCPA